MRIAMLRSLGLALVVCVATRAPAQAFKAGENYIGPSVSLSTYGSTAALGGNFEHAINKQWGWGIAAEYYSYSLGYLTTSYSVKYISLAGTAAYHFEVKSNKKLDPFVGGAVGYNIVSNDCKDANLGNFDCGHASSLLIGGFGGVRYWVKDNLALVGRTGFGLGFLTVGVDFRM